MAGHATLTFLSMAGVDGRGSIRRCGRLDTKPQCQCHVWHRRKRYRAAVSNSAATVYSQIATLAVDQSTT